MGGVRAGREGRGGGGGGASGEGGGYRREESTLHMHDNHRWADVVLRQGTAGLQEKDGRLCRW